MVERGERKVTDAEKRKTTKVDKEKKTEYTNDTNRNKAYKRYY